MLRKFLFSLIGLALILLLDSFSLTADAAVKDADVYSWNSTGAGRVCQKITFHPQSQAALTPSGQMPVKIHTEFVANRFCK